MIEPVYHIFMHHPEWCEPLVAEAATAKEVSNIIGEALREHYMPDQLDGLFIKVVHGVVVPTEAKQKDVAVVQVGDNKYLVGVDEEQSS